tara:strand:+ start:303 stop:656 length:354 start_codon:yes stop_codon:yes gene_type:complete
MEGTLQQPMAFSNQRPKTVGNNLGRGPFGGAATGITASDFNPDHMGMNYNISDYDNNVLPQTQKVFHAQDFGPNAVISNQTSAAPSNQEIAQFSQKYTAQAGIASKQESEFLQNEAM